MATRPIFIPSRENAFPRISQRELDFQWFPGLSATQKKKSAASLHDAAEKLGIFPVLEISTKSSDPIGVNLSAFNLFITTKKYKQKFSVECAYQGSKVFEHGGPFVDLLAKTSREAKKDVRIKASGSLVYFKFFSEIFELKPRTFFYDWIYINALNQNEELAEKTIQYSGFTDIEFNPEKSINCQAYSAALFVSLVKSSLLDEAIKSPKDFLQILAHEYKDRDARYFKRFSD